MHSLLIRAIFTLSLLYQFNLSMYVIASVIINTAPAENAW